MGKLRITQEERETEEDDKSFGIAKASSHSRASGCTPNKRYDR